MGRTKLAGFVAALAILSGTANAQIRITEWMYNGTDEFIEFTNLTTSVVDMTGWSYDDDSRAAGTFSLSAFGLVGPGESVILSEQSEQDFRDLWDSMPATVKVIGNNSVNLGRNDEINIFDNLNNLVDRLAYGDQNYPGTIRTDGKSGNPASPSVLPADTVGAPGDWVLAAVGDRFGSYASLAGDIANPGIYVDYDAAIPEPATVILALLVVGSMAAKRRR